MGHIIFALGTQVFIKLNNGYVNLKDEMKFDLCVCEAQLDACYHGNHICGHDYQLIKLEYIVKARPEDDSCLLLNLLYKF